MWSCAPQRRASLRTGNAHRALLPLGPVVLSSAAGLVSLEDGGRGQGHRWSSPVCRGAAFDVLSCLHEPQFPICKARIWDPLPRACYEEESIPSYILESRICVSRPLPRPPSAPVISSLSASVSLDVASALSFVLPGPQTQIFSPKQATLSLYFLRKYNLLANIILLHLISTLSYLPLPTSTQLAIA